MRSRPRNVSTQVWTDICALVVSVIVAYQPNNDRRTRRLTASAARFVLWAVTELRAPVVASDLFRSNVINKYVRKRYAAGHSQTSAAAELASLATAASGIHVGRPARHGNPGVGQYTERQQADIRAWSRSRPERVRHNTMALVGLAGGAGLRTAEATSIRARDISTRHSHLIVNVVDGPWPRLVPVSATWVPLLSPAMQERASDEYLVLPNVHSLKARMPIARQLCNVDDDSPALAKLRDTWVIDQLSRVPVGILTHVAGFRNLTSLSTRYGTFTSVGDDAASAPFYDLMVGEQR